MHVLKTQYQEVPWSIPSVSLASSHTSYIGSDLKVFYNVVTTFFIIARAPRRVIRCTVSRSKVLESIENLQLLLFSYASFYSHQVSGCDSKDTRFQLTFVSLRISALSQQVDIGMVSDLHIFDNMPLSCMCKEHSSRKLIHRTLRECQNLTTVWTKNVVFSN